MWVLLGQLAWPQLCALSPTWNEIQTAVHDNAKQRFALQPASATIPANSESPSDWLIRANQGHSIPLSSAQHLTRVTLETAPVAVHGTYGVFWPLIVAAGGLRAMGRNHVHFAQRDPEPASGGGGGGGVVSGMRADAELAIHVDVAATLRDGTMEWWTSENGVVLTEGDDHGVVPLRYFTLVEGRGRVAKEVGVLWKDGLPVGELPALAWRTPFGKKKVAAKG